MGQKFIFVLYFSSAFGLVYMCVLYYRCPIDLEYRHELYFSFYLEIFQKLL